MVAHFTKIYTFITVNVTYVGHFCSVDVCAAWVCVPEISCLLHYFAVSHLEPKSTWPPVSKRGGRKECEHEIRVEGCRIFFF